MHRLKILGLCAAIVFVAGAMEGCVILRPVSAVATTAIKTTGKVVGAIIP